MKFLRPTAALCAAVLCFCVALKGADADGAPASPPIAAAARALAPDDARLADNLARFYASRGGEPAWRENGSWSARARAAAQALRNAADEGLNPARYGARELSAIGAPDGGDDAAYTDALLSAAMLRYIGDVRSGQVPPQMRPRDFNGSTPLPDPVPVLQGGLAAPDFSAWLASLPPANPEYARLREALRRCRDLAGGSWPRFGDGPSIKPGAEDARVPTLRVQLARLGDLAPPHDSESGQTFDVVLETAVRKFQRRHGIADDGVVGPRTRAELNVPPAARAAQIAVNMERLRWYPPLGDARHLVVNVPSFDLTGFEDGKPIWRMPVIVGQRKRPTPMFSDRMTQVIFLPSWTAPEKIAREDILPRIKRDPGYLENNRFQVFQDWSATACEVDPRSIDWASLTARTLTQKFRQRPGPGNALGLIRFTLANDFDIYLHDTPHKELFSKPERAFSSGCIRVADALTLATYALKGNLYWSREKIDEAMAGEKTLVVELAKPIPVQVTYWTAWVDEDGSLQFRDDIYGRDLKVSRILGLPRAP